MREQQKKKKKKKSLQAQVGCAPYERGTPDAPRSFARRAPRGVCEKGWPPLRRRAGDNESRGTEKSHESGKGAKELDWNPETDFPSFAWPRGSP